MRAIDREASCPRLDILERLAAAAARKSAIGVGHVAQAGRMGRRPKFPFFIEGYPRFRLPPHRLTPTSPLDLTALRSARWCSFRATADCGRVMRHNNRVAWGSVVISRLTRTMEEQRHDENRAPPNGLMLCSFVTALRDCSDGGHGVLTPQGWPDCSEVSPHSQTRVRRSLIVTRAWLLASLVERLGNSAGGEQRRLRVRSRISR